MHTSLVLTTPFCFLILLLSAFELFFGLDLTVTTAYHAADRVVKLLALLR